MCALLLYYGANSNTQVDFEGLQADRSLFTPYRVAEKGSPAEVLLALLKGKLQANNLKSSLPINMTHVAKDKLIDSVRPFVGSAFNQSLSLSRGAEAMLCRHDLPYTYKQSRLAETIHSLNPDQFIWLSNGFRNHAVDLIVECSAQGDLKFVIANRGNWAQQYHSVVEKGELFLFCPKVYILPAKTSARQLGVVVDYLARAITTTYEDFNMDFFVEGPAFYARFDLSGQFPEVNELRQHGKPGVPQVLNNCTTISLWAALDYLLSSREPELAQTKLQNIYDAYDNAWSSSIQEAVPEMSQEDLVAIVSQAKVQSEPSFNLAHLLYLMAEETSNSDGDRLSLYQDAQKNYQSVLTRDTGGPELEGPLSEALRRFISEHIEKCELQINSLRKRLKSGDVVQTKNHLYWFSKAI